VLPSTSDETCNKADVYVASGRAPVQSGQLLLIVADPGLTVIIAGLSLIMVLMIVFFLCKPRATRALSDPIPAGTGK
jgi:hypothetical protein